MEFVFDREGVEVGIDEAGRGCLSGRVYVGAVILPIYFEDDMTYLEIKDSKKISRKKRKVLREWIEKNAISYSVGWIDEKEIDQINILQATFKAMHKALDGINVDFDRILVDGDKFKLYEKNGEPVEAICIKGGDNKYYSIAAASILAKVYHDEYVEELCNRNPDLDKKYGWLSNMGYGTKKHMDGIKEYGITKYHRLSFGLCKNM